MKASDIRRGHVLMIDGAPCRVMDFQHRTPGNLRAFVQVLHRDANGLHVMDNESYEQYTLDNEIMGDAGQWLESGMTFIAEWLNGRPIGIELPSVVELDVVETAPIMKTATKTASTKPAKLSNGLTIQVPEFVGEGDRVRVNPREGVYLERAK